jgi:hypothetical protein
VSKSCSTAQEESAAPAPREKKMGQLGDYQQFAHLFYLIRFGQAAAALPARKSGAIQNVAEIVERNISIRTTLQESLDDLADTAHALFLTNKFRLNDPKCEHYWQPSCLTALPGCVPAGIACV